ncbi:MAG: DNA primase [Lachnospiraceae bacterium]
MPYYPEELIEEIRQRNDIVDVVGSYVHLQKKGSTYFGLCPFHNEKTPSFSVSPGKQMYYCFGCGAGGNVYTFLQEYENYTFPEAVEYLADRAGIELPKQEMSKEDRERQDKRTRILEINKEAGKYYYSLLRSPRGKQAMEYFTNRQLSKETMQKFGLGYSDKYSDDLYQYLRKKGYSDEILKESGLITIDEVRGGHDKFWNRAMFPIMDIHSKIIGFGGRVMGDGEPKYLNSPETIVFDKSRNLYGLHIARSSKRPYMLLCEGYMDVIALHQAGFDNAVASLGTSFTTGHAALLKRYTDEVYLTFDSDGAGIKAALRAIPILKEVGIKTKVITMTPHKDPDEFIKSEGADAYQQRIDQAQNSFFFEIRILQEQYDMKDPEGKTDFFKAVAEKLAGFTEKLERTNYIEAVAAKYQIRFDLLNELVNQCGQRIGIQPQNTEKKNGKAQKPPQEDGMKKSQKLLLTWLIEDTKLFPIVEKYISPEDFTEELYQKIAEELLLQYRETNTVNPARIVSMFQEEEEQREVAGLFHETLKQVDSRADREVALKETIIRMKQNRIAQMSKTLAPNDIAGMQQLITEKRNLQELQKLHISID